MNPSVFKLRVLIFKIINIILNIIGYRIITNLNKKITIEKNIFFDEFKVHKTYFKLNQKLIIFDVGSYLGEVLNQYKKKFYNSIIYSFEPSSENFSILEKKYNADNNIVLNKLAVGSKNAICQLYKSSKYSSGNSLIKSKNNFVTKFQEGVQVVTLDDYCKENSINKVDILKLDVQGYEEECLQGAEKLLLNNKIKLIKLEIMFHQYYAKDTSFFKIEQILNKYKFYLLDISFIKKSSKINRTLSVDVIYGQKY